MYCTKCGNKLNSRQKTCPKCGQPAATKLAKKTTVNLNTVSLILGVVFLESGILTSIFFFLSSFFSGFFRVFSTMVVFFTFGAALANADVDKFLNSLDDKGVGPILDIVVITLLVLAAICFIVYFVNRNRIRNGQMQNRQISKRAVIIGTIIAAIVTLTLSMVIIMLSTPNLAKPILT